MNLTLRGCLRRRGFTLIELLIVVAIIAILAAIAVPNFLEAQTRSKVSRCLNDMRSMRTALESYAVDNNHYPENDAGLAAFTAGQFSHFRLTTPIAYMTTMPKSPFIEKYGSSGGPADPKIASTINGYLYTPNYRVGDPAGTIYQSYKNDRAAYLGPINLLPVNAQTAIQEGGFWIIKSVGPDGIDDRDSVGNGGFSLNARVYDPTNGTVSRGDIVTFSDRSGNGKNI